MYVCKKLVKLDGKIFQARLLDKGNIVESYARQDSIFDKRPIKKDEGFNIYPLTYIGKKQ